MPFQEGNTYGKGPPKKLKTQVKDFIKEYPQAVEQLMLTLYEQGINGDTEAAKYVIDRIKGKPKTNIGIAEDDKGLLAASVYLRLCELQDKASKPLQKASKCDIIDVEVEDG